MSSESSEYRFDVAVSFAGEDRELVESIVSDLEAKGLRVFYDDRFKVDLWGEDLVEYFTKVYLQESRFAVMFVSRHYAEKVWTNLERRTVLARALVQRSAYMLPVRLDDTQLNGLLPTVGYLDARVEGAGGIVSLLLAKVGTGQVEEPSQEVLARKVPRTASELERMLYDKPDLWEHFVFAGLLLQGKEHLEERFLDYEMGYAESSGVLAGEAAYNYLQSIPSRMTSHADTFNAVLNLKSQEAAFGLPGQPGDVARIRHLAQRVLDVYRTFFDIADELRGMSLPDVLRDPRDALVEAIAPSIANIRQFIDQFVIDIEDIPRKVEAGEDVILEVVVKLDLNDQAMTRYTKGMNKARKRL